jgi:hypothetical protein
MNERPAPERLFVPTIEEPCRTHWVTWPFAAARAPDASSEIEGEIASWVNEGGAGGEVKR